MSHVLHRSLEILFRELIDGPEAAAAWMLNSGDIGLLRSLDKLTAEAASTAPVVGAASIAAHVDHVRYGLSLMNRWSHGERAPLVSLRRYSSDRPFDPRSPRSLTARFHL